MELSGADLIICDIEMPGLNGYETVSIIREFLGERWLPIIFITKHNRVKDFLAGFDVGADDYLVKPVNEKILKVKMRVMERFINMQKQLNEARNTPEQATKFDKLTHVYSSAHFFDLALLHWSILIRQSLPASLLLIDIDFFKPYRDHYGEKASIECLKKVAGALTNSARRPSDFVGRITEDDFIILLPETSKDGAVKVAERILEFVEALNIEHKLSRVLGVVSVSIGIATANNLRKYSLEKTVEEAGKALEMANANPDTNTVHLSQGNNYKIKVLTSMQTSSV